MCLTNRKQTNTAYTSRYICTLPKPHQLKFGEEVIRCVLLSPNIIDQIRSSPTGHHFLGIFGLLWYLNEPSRQWTFHQELSNSSKRFCICLFFKLNLTNRKGHLKEQSLGSSLRDPSSIAAKIPAKLPLILAITKGPFHKLPPHILWVWLYSPILLLKIFLF